MKQLALLLALAIVAGTAAGAEDRAGRAGQNRNSYADPSAVIAAELAFARAAQEKGQWRAFAATAASDAVMFVPQMVLAQTWLRGRPNPAIAIKWQAHSVTSSCDGSLMVSQGAWQGPQRTGYFTTIWQRQKNGSYKWIVDSGDSVKDPLAAPEMIVARIADCPPRSRRTTEPPARTGEARRPLPFDPARRIGQSDDGTLRWGVTVDRGGARHLTVDWTRNGAETPLIDDEVAAPGGQ